MPSLEEGPGGKVVMEVDGVAGGGVTMGCNSIIFGRIIHVVKC